METPNLIKKIQDYKNRDREEKSDKYLFLSTHFPKLI